MKKTIALSIFLLLSVTPAFCMRSTILCVIKETCDVVTALSDPYDNGSVSLELTENQKEIASHFEPTPIEDLKAAWKICKSLPSTIYDLVELSWSLGYEFNKEKKED